MWPELLFCKNPWGMKVSQQGLTGRHPSTMFLSPPRQGMQNPDPEVDKSLDDVFFFPTWSTTCENPTSGKKTPTLGWAHTSAVFVNEQKLPAEAAAACTLCFAFPFSTGTNPEPKPLEMPSNPTLAPLQPWSLAGWKQTCRWDPLVTTAPRASSCSSAGQQRARAPSWLHLGFFYSNHIRSNVMFSWGSAPVSTETLKFPVPRVPTVSSNAIWDNCWMSLSHFLTWRLQGV